MKNPLRLSLALVIVGILPAEALQADETSVRTPFTPREFRDSRNHQNEPCERWDYICLYDHLVYLTCGAVVVEKLPMSKSWLLYSIHSGPRLPFDYVLFFRREIIGFEVDIEEWNEFAPRITEQTLAWMDSQDWNETDLCELREFWKNLIGADGDTQEQGDELSAALWQSAYEVVEVTLPSALAESGLRATITPREFREFFAPEFPSCTGRPPTPGCLVFELMYSTCGAVLIEKLTFPEREPPDQWYIYSLHGSPKVPFDAFLYFSPTSFLGDLRSRSPFDEFESHIQGNGPYDHQHIPNSPLVDFATETIAWMDSQDWSLTDLCELREYWEGFAQSDSITAH